MPRFRKKPIAIEADQWFKNGDHPLDDALRPFADYNPDGSVTIKTPAEPREGAIVRRFRRPDLEGVAKCYQCSKVMDIHGWIDTLEGGHIVCPGDWIITGVRGEFYPCKDDIFEETYEKIDGNEA